MALRDLRPVTQELELLSPKDDTPLGIFLKVVGPDSKQVRDIERALQKEGIERGKTGADIEIGEIEQVLIKKFAASIVGWDEKFNEDMEGPYTPEYALKIMSDPDFRWVVDQVAGYVSKRHNFFL